jgi:ketosteroid isomerase-like protein
MQTHGRAFRSLVGLCFALALVACQKPADTRAADEAAIRHVLDEVGKRFSAGDYPGMFALYSDDVVVSAPGAPDIVGKAAWQQGLDANMPKGIKLNLRFDTQELEVSGDIGYERGTYAIEFVDPATHTAQPVVTGRHVHIFRRQPDGTWLGWRLMENSSDPATAPKPPTAAAKP